MIEPCIDLLLIDASESKEWQGGNDEKCQYDMQNSFSLIEGWMNEVQFWNQYHVQNDAYQK